MIDEKNYAYRVSAAGRVNLIGEHVDYCGGKVMPAALSLKNTVYVRPNGTDKINLSWTDIPARITLEIGKLGEYKDVKYANYPAGSAYFWQQAGHKVIGCDMLLDCTVPFGSGLSSSAAIEVSTIAALATVAGEAFDPVEVALVAQKAEHEYAGVNCGIMDQYASACGKKDNAILLDCKTLVREYVPILLGDYALVIANCNKPHSLVESKYNERRAETELALELYEAFDHPEFFHVGCDEAYNAGSCSLCARYDYSELFADHLRFFHDLFRERGCRIMMWHDMLLDRADPRWNGFICFGNRSLSELYKTLPKDIVICDWQYSPVFYPDGSPREDWITSEFFQNAGFDTLSCPWLSAELILSIGRHAAKKHQFGVLQTVWHKDRDGALDFYGAGSAAAWNPEAGSRPVVTVRQECFNRYVRDIAHDMNLMQYTDFGRHQYQVIPESHQN